MYDIAICLDNNFLMQAATLLRSISETNKKHTFTIWLLSENISEENKECLSADFAGSNLKINFTKIDISSLPSLPLEGKVHLSIATYYRLMLPWLLPESVTKILYLDCDMIVLNDLAPLFETDLQGVPAGTTLDMFDADTTINERLDYDTSAGYMNAGMLLINLPEWRNFKISEKAIDFLRNHPEKCLAHDQDALNHALNGNYVRLSATYNMQLDFFTEMNDVILKPESIPDIVESLENPAIIHFTGPTKPWKKNCIHPYMPLWDYFQNKTSWSNMKKTWEYHGVSLHKYFLKKVLLFLQLYKDKKPFLDPAYFTASLKLEELKGKCTK